MTPSPVSPHAALELALSLQRRGRLEDAAALHAAVLVVDPRNFDALHLLGVVRYRQKRFAEAEPLLREAAALAPGNAAAQANLGNLLRDTGRPAEALACYDAALAAAPGAAAGFLLNRAIACIQLERHAQAEADLARARRLAPDNADIRMAEGVSRLARGDFLHGWPLYEARLARPGMPPLPGPRWDGRATVAGRRVLVVPEQGIGDTVLALRYARLLQARRAIVVLQVQPALRSLVRESFAGVECCVVGERPPAHDFACHALSLPGLFGTTLGTVPAAVPYLRVPAADAARWVPRTEDDGRLRVGLCWRGNPAYDDDRRRSMPLARLARVLEVPGCRFFSLQREVVDEDRALLGALEPLGPDFGDVVDNAAAISRMDIVITVDTATAHLAGALGVPAWVMLSVAPYWPWGLRGAASPWYPSARLFRQRSPGDWDRVAADLSAALAEATR